ncbi:hypothetical protein D9M71_539500 [compost metagenome]
MAPIRGLLEIALEIPLVEAVADDFTDRTYHPVLGRQGLAIVGFERPFEVSLSDLFLLDLEFAGHSFDVRKFVHRRQLLMVADQERPAPALKGNHQFRGLSTTGLVDDDKVEIHIFDADVAGADTHQRSAYQLRGLGQEFLVVRST